MADGNIYSAYGLVDYPLSLDYIHKRDSQGNVLNPNSTKVNTYLLQWLNKKDVVYGEHVNVLQDALFSIEQALGTSPYLDINNKMYDANGNVTSTMGTVDGRLTAIEKSVSNSLLTMTSNINGHHHTGGSNAPTKIDLTKEVTGLLPRANIDLTYSGTGITADTILANSSQSINTILSTKYPTSGGNISGNVTVQGSLSVNGYTCLKNYFEADSTYFSVGSGSMVGPQTWSGIGSAEIIRSISSGSGSMTNLCYIDATNLKAGRYAITFRVGFLTRSSWPSSGQFAFQLQAGAYGNGNVSTVNIIGDDISDSGYYNYRVRSFYMIVDIGSNPGDVSYPRFAINYIPNLPYDICCDGVVVQAAHTAVIC